MVIDKKWFKDKIKRFLSEDESNKMDKVDGSLIFDPEVLVGFASGNDSIFEDYKKIIGTFHLTPIEAFTKYCEKNKLPIPSPFDNLSVVAFILSINEMTKKENFKYSKEMPAERWAHTRLFGEQSNQKLQKYLISELKKEGISAVAPMTERYMFKIRRKHENGVWASTWSHRHVCFAAGLGFFGLSDGFINEKGIAMRCGSIVINYKLPSDADKRPEDPYNDYCLKCGACIKRCPADAINFKTRHDKQKCSLYVMDTVPFIKTNFGINIYSCGLCQVGVPCENRPPLL